MKRIIALLFLLSFSSINAQETATKMGPILEDFGQVFQIENPELLLDKDKVYKVIFDIYTDPSKKEGQINPLLNTVARYLNMHAQHGVSAENMKTVIILHGAPTKSTLNATAYKKKYSTENSNTELMSALNNVGVEIFVCGQSYLASGFELEDKSSDVKLALSALTALVKFQSEGYELISFN